VGAGEEQWADASWAQDDEDDEAEAEAVDLNDTAAWEGGWAPPAEDFSLFDERLHPMHQPVGRRLSHEHAAQQRQMPTPDVATVSNFIRSLTQTARMGAEASVVALAYIERLVSSGGFTLDGNTWRRCALTAWLLAAKMWDDECFENREFAQLFARDVTDLNALESKFCSAIGFRLSVSPSEYARYYFVLRQICQTTEEAFALRPLDAELEAKLERSKHSVRGAALGKWADWLPETDLSRSV